MRQMVNTILKQYGTSIQISGSGGERTVKGFFQPVRAKSWQSMVNMDTPAGEVPRRQFIYIGPGDTEVAEGEMVTVGKKHYLLRRVEQYHYGDQAVYTWGMCVEKGGSDTWGSQF